MNYELQEALANVPQVALNQVVLLLRAVYGDSFATATEAASMLGDINQAIDVLSSCYRPEVRSYLRGFFFGRGGESPKIFRQFEVTR